MTKVSIDAADNLGKRHYYGATTMTLITIERRIALLQLKLIQLVHSRAMSIKAEVAFIMRALGRYRVMQHQLLIEA